MFDDEPTEAPADKYDASIHALEHDHQKMQEEFDGESSEDEVEGYNILNPDTKLDRKVAKEIKEA